MNTLSIVRQAAGRNLSDPGALEDYFLTLRLLEEEDGGQAHSRNREVRRLSGRYSKELKSPQDKTRMLDIYRRSLLFDAPLDFDAYCRYIEWNRERPFYMPRRKQLYPIAKALQRLCNGELDLLAISLPPGVGKTTLALFLLTFLAGREPDRPILGGSHSNSFLRGAYEECVRIMDPKGEYLWCEVFPSVRIVKTNAEDLFLDLGSRKRFATLQFRSIGSGNAGVVRAEQLLYCDDLCQGIEEAMSRERMDSLWQKYTTDLRQRKIGNCKELHIATRWSVHDVIGRLERSEEEKTDSKAEFIALPALNDEDESNFDYGNAAGFSTGFYHAQREIMDEASWRALYMNQPIEREGQLYSESELRYYFELPQEEPDAILAVCDTKDKGTDYCFMPVVYRYGMDFYLDACVYDNGNPEAVEAQIINLLLKRRVQLCQFESNAAGGQVAKKIQKSIKEQGGITKITTKYTTANKETKIIVNSPFVKERVLFRDKSTLKEDRQYRKMLSDLCGYTMSGKNKHDDAPDGMAMLSLYVQGFQSGGVQIIKRPV